MSNGFTTFISFPAKCDKCGISFTIENAGGSKAKMKIVRGIIRMSTAHYCNDCWELIK